MLLLFCERTRNTYHAGALRQDPEETPALPVLPGHPEAHVVRLGHQPEKLGVPQVSGHVAVHEVQTATCPYRLFPPAAHLPQRQNLRRGHPGQHHE